MESCGGSVLLVQKRIHNFNLSGAKFITAEFHLRDSTPGAKPFPISTFSGPPSHYASAKYTFMDGWIQSRGENPVFALLLLLSRRRRRRKAAFAFLFGCKHKRCRRDARGSCFEQTRCEFANETERERNCQKVAPPRRAWPWIFMSDGKNSSNSLQTMILDFEIISEREKFSAAFFSPYFLDIYKSPLAGEISAWALCVFRKPLGRAHSGPLVILSEGRTQRNNAHRP